MDLMLSANRSLTTTIGNDFLRADRDHTTLYGLAGNDTLRGASRQGHRAKPTCCLATKEMIGSTVVARMMHSCGNSLL
jgi:hypothetical protein